MNIIAENSNIRNYLWDICLPVDKISPIQFKHLNEFVSSVITLERKRTVSNISKQIFGQLIW